MLFRSRLISPFFQLFLGMVKIFNQKSVKSISLYKPHWPTEHWNDIRCIFSIALKSYLIHGEQGHQFELRPVLL